MKAYIVVTFLALGAAYWQMSGGAGFRPEAWPDATGTTTAAAASAPGQEIEIATRAETRPGDIVDVAARPPEIEVPRGTVIAAPAPAAAPPPSEPLSAAEALAAVAPDLAAALPLREAAAPGLGARAVTGDRVNMREGPGTDFAVVGQLGAGDLAEVIEADGGWVRVRAGGREGWMADRFLAAGG